MFSFLIHFILFLSPVCPISCGSSLGDIYSIVALDCENWVNYAYSSTASPTLSQFSLQFAINPVYVFACVLNANDSSNVTVTHHPPVKSTPEFHPIPSKIECLQIAIQVNSCNNCPELRENSMSIILPQSLSIRKMTTAYRSDSLSVPSHHLQMGSRNDNFRIFLRRWLHLSVEHPKVIDSNFVCFSHVSIRSFHLLRIGFSIFYFFYSFLLFNKFFF